MQKTTFVKILYLVIAIAFFVAPGCVPALSNAAPGIAIAAGVIFAIFLGNPFLEKTSKLTHNMLALAIVGIGFGRNLIEVLQAGMNGIIYTVIGIAAGLGLGLLIGKKLKMSFDGAWLISAGTSICGGSAIAAVAPVLKAKAPEVAMATATVFMLNAVALWVFPIVGHALDFNQTQFGYFAALAIHDTSSVVGASMQYGQTALEVGTTVKLARALWIIPLTLGLSLYLQRRNHNAEEGGNRRKISVPWFIPGFLIAAAIVTWVPSFQPVGTVLKNLAEYLLVTTLFVIGSNLSLDKIKKLGWRPIVHGIILWIILSVGWGSAIYLGLVNCAE